MKPVLGYVHAARSVATLSLAATIGTVALTALPARAAPTGIRPLGMVAPRAIRRAATNAATAYSSAVLSAGPLAFYRLNDTSTTMTDSGPNALNGTYGPGVTLGSSAVTSTGDTSAFFSGGPYNLSNVGSVPASAALQPPSAVSIEGWVSAVEYNRYNTYIPLVSYGRQAQGPAYVAQLSPQNSVYVWVKTSGGSAGVQSKSTMLAGQVHQFACTYDGATLSIYIDGKLENSKPLSGTIDYSGIHPYDGLGIGGSLDGAQPIFNGTLSEVSVYGRALSASDVQAHYVSGVKPTLINEVPASADSIVEMEGVNTHFHYTQSVYATQFPTIQSLLVGLGIRHLRDGMEDTTWQPYYDHLNALGNAGIKTTFTTDRNLTTPAVIAAYPQRMSKAFEAYEGPNEQDLNFTSDPQWPQKAVTFQKLLYSTVRGNPALSKYPVVGPSLTSIAAYQAVGDISAYEDNGNFHEYFSGRNPGTSGWGSHSSYGIYGSISWNLNASAIMNGTKPITVTETGYDTGAGDPGNCPLDIQEKYITRTYLEMYLHGIKRALVYQLVDVNGSLGIVNADLSPKPAYYALMNMNAMLADQGSAFTPTPLTFLIAGNMSNVHHLLMQKRDGSYYLALWIEAPSWTPSSGTSGGGTYIAVPNQDVTITLPANPRSMSLTSWNTAGSTSTTAMAANANSTVSVSDSLSIVHIVP